MKEYKRKEAIEAQQDYYSEFREGWAAKVANYTEEDWAGLRDEMHCELCGYEFSQQEYVQMSCVRRVCKAKGNQSMAR